MSKNNLWISSDSVTTELKGSSSQEIIEELVSLLEKSGKVNDRNQVVSDILKREAAASTFIRKEISVPHATSKGVSSICAAAGISRKKEIYVLTVWPDCTPHNLKCIAALMNFLNADGELEKILSAKDNSELYQLFEKGIKQRL